MKQSDYILALTVGLLTCDDSCLASAMAVHENGSIDYHAPRAPRKISVGAAAENGSTMGLFEWVRALRTDRLPAVQVIDSRAFGRRGTGGMPDLPAHIAASFAGAEATLLLIRDEERSVLYSLQNIFSSPVWMSASLFADWTTAQPDQDALWSLILLKVNETASLNDRPGQSRETIVEFLHTDEGQAFFDFNYDSLLRSVHDALRERGKAPVIPREHAQFFEPGQGLRLVENPQPYTLFLFVPVKVPDGSGVPEAATSTRSDFLSALHEIEEFARSVDSPFFEAFRLAAWVLETETAVLGREPAEDFAASPGREGFSGRALSVLTEEASLVAVDFRPLGWSEERLLSLLSCSIADVFGGMGSWNDLGFSGDEQGTYERLTERMYRALRDFFVSAVLNGA
jgi:hypothetical protein